MTLRQLKARRNALRRRLFKIVEERDAHQRALDRSTGQVSAELRAKVDEYSQDTEDCRNGLAILDTKINEMEGVTT